MYTSAMRLLAASALVAAGAVSVGCAVRVYGPPPPAAEVTVGGPVVDGGVAVEEAPPPDDREYVYDEGFPPGVYLYGGYYYYNGYRYPHDVFINRYVTVNRREGRFVDVGDNRRRGEVIRTRQRDDFAHYGARHGERVAPRGDEHRDDRGR